MFERFTKRARRVLVLAQEENRALGGGWIGVEHLLLGLLGEPEGVAGRVLVGHGLTLESTREDIRRRGGAASVSDEEALRTIGIDIDEVRSAVEESFGRGALDRARRKKTTCWAGPTFTPRAKKVLELALREALALDHSYVGTEHLLLGILREGDSLAVTILAERAGTPAALRSELLHAIPKVS